jgi:hypothetical protein
MMCPAGGQPPAGLSAAQGFAALRLGVSGVFSYYRSIVSATCHIICSPERVQVRSGAFRSVQVCSGTFR